MAAGQRRSMSLRTRLALLFAVGSTVILALSSALLYVNFSSEVNAAINSGLVTQASDIDANLRPGAPLSRNEEQFAQIVSAGGEVLAASGTLTGRPSLLDADELGVARHRRVIVDRAVAGLSHDARLLARPAHADRNMIVVVGTRLDALHRAQRRLGLLLAVTSPLLIGALAVGGLAITTLALRPVRQMTEEADRFSMDDPGHRLAVPATDDEIASLAMTLNAMLERIEQSFRRERAFVDDASHELRTPLAILRGELELALADAGDREDVASALRSALEEAERLTRIAEDLLVLARADAGMLTVRADDVDLVEIARHAADRVGRQSPAVRIQVEGNGVAVRGDDVWLEQLVVNLLANAARVASRVEVRVASTDKEARLTVADDGPGFPRELLPVAFDRFASAHRREGDAGAGLGLAIVAAFAAAHGGHVTASNGSPLGGASVDVTLPLAP